MSSLKVDSLKGNIKTTPALWTFTNIQLISISTPSSPYSQYLQAQTMHPHITDTNFLSICNRLSIFVKKIRIFYKNC